MHCRYIQSCFFKCVLLRGWKSGTSQTDPWGFRAAAGTHVVFVAVAAGVLSFSMGCHQALDLKMFVVQEL